MTRNDLNRMRETGNSLNYSPILSGNSFESKAQVRFRLKLDPRGRVSPALNQTLKFVFLPVDSFRISPFNFVTPFDS